MTISTMVWRPFSGINFSTVPDSVHTHLLGPVSNINSNETIIATFQVNPFLFITNGLVSAFIQVGQNLFQQTHTDLSANSYLLQIVTSP